MPMSCYWWADTSTGKGNSTLLVKKVSHPGPIGHFRMHCHWILLRQDVIIFKLTTRRNPAIGNDMGLSGMVTDSIYSPSSMTRIYPLHAKTGLLQVLFAGSCHITRRYSANPPIALWLQSRSFAHASPRLRCSPNSTRLCSDCQR